MGLRDWFRRGSPIIPEIQAKPLPLHEAPPRATKEEGPRLIVSPSQSGQAIWNDWQVSSAVTYGMKSSSWVFVAIRKRMSYVGTVPWHAERWSPHDAAWIRDDNCPLAGLIAQPNPFQEWSDLQKYLISHLVLAGNGVWFKNRTGNGQVKWLWVLSPDAVHPIPDQTDFLSGYKVDMGSGSITVKPTEIVHFQHHDPANQWSGIGNLQAGAKAVDVDIESSNYQRNSLANMAAPSGIFTPKETMSYAQWSEAQAVMEEHWGGAVRAGKILVATGDGTFTPAQMTPQELMFIESRKLSAIEICAICEIQPTLVGVIEHPTYSNFSTARRVQWEDTEIPHLIYVREVLNMQLANEFGDGYRCNFDVTRVPALMEVFAARVDTAVKLFGMGVPLNAINTRLEMGLPLFDHGDTPYVGSSYMQADSGLDPLGMNDGPAAPPASAQNDDE